LKSEKISSSLALIEDHFGQEAKAHAGPLLLVHNQSLARVLPPMKFNDMVHVAEDGPMVTFLSNALCQHLLNIKAVSVCQPQAPTK
jgi:hypothetical protein